MAQHLTSDFIPFKYEPLRRTDRIVERSQQDLARDKADAMRMLRGTGNPRDTTPSKLAEEWRNSLLPRLKTSELCERYPRIANRIALCWSDQALTRRLLDDLLRDRRGGREGFPAAVHAELVALAAEVGVGFRTTRN